MIQKSTTVILPIGSPVELLERKEYSCHEILISYGGGMGGANKKYRGYIKMNNDQCVVIDDLVVGEIELRQRFIVCIEPVKIVEETYDVTGHPYFGDVGNRYQRLLCVPANNIIKYEVRGEKKGYEEFKIIKYTE